MFTIQGEFLKVYGLGLGNVHLRAEGFLAEVQLGRLQPQPSSILGL